jgi:hypothetical protein
MNPFCAAATWGHGKPRKHYSAAEINYSQAFSKRPEFFLYAGHKSQGVVEYGIHAR